MNELYERKPCLTAKTDAKAFAEALKKAGMVLGKSRIPVLEEIFVRFSNGKCILTGTDLETYLIAEISAEGDDFAFVFARTKDVERACRYFDEELTFEWTETDSKNHWSMVRLSCGPRVAEFDAYPAEEYPILPSVEGPTLFSANAADLLERINRVSYAAMKPGYSSREAACCVEFVESQIYAVDGVRAAWDTDPSLTFPQSFLIHAAPLSYLKVFGGQTVNFQLSGHNLRASANGMTAFFRVSETVPLRLMDAVPPRYVEEFSVSPKNILDELAYLRNVTPPTNKPYVYLAGNELSMPVNGKKYSTAVNIERTGDLPVGFDLYHITDAFKQFGKEKQVRVKLSGINMPIVIEAEGRSDCATRIHESKSVVNGVERVTKRLFCDNADCPTRRLRQFVHFAGKKAMDIEGLSDGKLEKLIGWNLLSTPLDIYELDAQRDMIVMLEGFGERSWQNLWDAIQRSRDTTFERYLIAMDIPQIGNTASRTLARQFHSSLDELEAAVCNGFDFTQLPDFGETLHQNINQWFQSEENWYLWSELRNHVRIAPPPAEPEPVALDNPFVGKTVVVTGKVEPYTRDGINAKIESLGAHAGSSVSSKTNYLVCGENAGSKLEKARSLGITVLTPAQFFQMAGA